MRTNGLFRLGLVRLCLALVLLGIGGISVQAQADFSIVALPGNALPFVRGDAALVNLLDQVDGELLMGHVDALQNMGTRHVNSPKNMPDQGIGAASRYIISQFEAIRAQSPHLSVSTQAFSVTWAGQTSQLENIIAVIPGTQPEAGAIVIGAHYDSRCADLNDASSYAPGANDNASGTAALIELARILGARHHRVTIIFVAFSAEEIGRVGSSVFVRDYLQALDIPVSAMINLDMIGGSNAGGDFINDGQIRLFSAGPDESPSRRLARTVHLAAYHYVPDMEIAVQDRTDRWGRYGDHMSFSDAGYPAVRFIEEHEDANHQHNGFDTIDGIQIPYLKRATQTVLVAVTALADGPLPPQNASLSGNGDGAPTFTWDAVPGAARYVVALRSTNSLVYDLQFEVSGASIQWGGFDPARFAGVAISAMDADGLMGPLSEEYRVA